MTQTAIRRTDQASSVHPQLAEVGGSMITSTAAKALAVLRISTGFVFLWAFLDKTFGLITGAIKWGDANFAFVQLRCLRGHTPWPPP
jgi:hypothetical protein